MKTNFEKVIDFNNCFGSYVSNSLNSELFKTDPKLVDLKYSLINEEVHELFDAFNNNKIYTPINKKGKTGGVIYYELASTRPDLVLKDIIKITNPDLLTDYKFTFFEKMK